MSHKVLVHPPDGECECYEFGLTAEIADDLVKALKLQTALKRFAKELVKQMGRGVGVEFIRIEFQIINDQWPEGDNACTSG